MASLYRRKESKFWWIKFHDPVTGRIRQKSTRIEAGSTFGLRKAQELCAKLSIDEGASVVVSESVWDKWVTGFLEARHHSMAGTLKRNLSNWKTLRAYLLHVKVASPISLTRAHCIGYVAWRGRQGHLNSHQQSKRTISINTVLLELKTLSKLLHEALLRGWITSNPCLRLGIKRAAPREKAEMNNEQIQIIREALQQMPKGVTKEAMIIAFEIALHQGIRLNETNLDLQRVDLANMQFRVHAKGDKFYTVPINPALRPLLERLLNKGRKTAYTPQAMFGLRWFKFFNRLRRQHQGFANISFHSTRVSTVSRLHRAEVPQRLVMKLVNHASTTVHRVYVRIRAEEMTDAWRKMETPPLKQTSGGPSTTAAHAPPSSSGRG